MMNLKYLLSIIPVLFSYCFLVAQNQIVVQNGNNVALFSKLDSAIIYAQNGDTIYLPGGSFNLTQNIDKNLKIFGAGHNPDSTDATYYTQLIGEIKLLTGAEGGSLDGIFLSGSVSFGTSVSNQTVNNYSIQRCNFGSLSLGYNGTSNSSNNIFRENSIRGTVDGFDAQNNAFYSNIIGGSIQNFGISNIFKNNIFLKCYYNYIYYYYCGAVQSAQNCIFENNIFVCQGGTTDGRCSNGASVVNCIFNNNIFVENWTVCSGCQESNNYVNQPQSSIFINQSGYSFDYSHNYHLQPSSPGHNGGTDGTDVGIYGGIFPWKEGSVPLNPHLSFKNIPGVTNANGNLPINVKVKAQNN